MRGFFHPTIGYWQTITEPDAETVAGYPAGTQEIPLRPEGDFVWKDGAWVEVVPTQEEIDASAAAATEAFRSTAKLSFAQLLIGLVNEGWITVAEGRAWRDRVALPAPVAALIATLPAEQQFAAETRALAPSEVLRADPLVVALGAAEGKTPEELDDFFRTYAGV